MPTTPLPGYYNNNNVKPFEHANTEGVTKTYTGISIVVGNDIIGRITSWQPSAYSREGNHVYELGKSTWGRPVDYVPGKSGGYTISMARTEVWKHELELALGFGAVFNDLMDQTKPFTIEEKLFRGDSLYQKWTYMGCWFQERNEDGFAADGDGMYKVNATIAYVSRRAHFTNPNDQP